MRSTSPASRRGRSSGSDRLLSAPTDRITRWRLRTLGLSQPLAASPVDALASLVAVRADEAAMATWALAQRTAGSRGSDIDRLLDEQVIMRTHVVRGVWHLVLASDLRTLLQVTGPGARAAVSPSFRRHGLDDAMLAQADAVLREALATRALTRDELAQTLHRAGIPDATGERLGNMLVHAELSGILCSGPTRRGTRTYALLEDRIPGASEGDPLGNITARWFASHGPATAEDFGRWAGLPEPAVRDGLTRAGGRLASDVIQERRFWFAPDSEPEADFPFQRVVLLTRGDEWAVGADSGAAEQPLLLDGHLAGVWRVTVRRSHVAIDAQLREEWPRPAMQALQAEAEAYAAHLGLKARVTAAVGTTGLAALTEQVREAAPWLFPDDPRVAP